jgi:hypothetical protein
MATFYHRVPFLDPDLRKIGFGCARGSGGWNCVLNATTGRGGGQAVTYPADGQKDVPLAFFPGGEQPDPTPGSKDRRAGFPVTVTFPPAVQVRDVKASLSDGKGRDVPLWLWTPEQPVAPGAQGNAVGLIAKQPLQPDTAYTVRLEGRLDGKAWQQAWSFTTAKK